MKRVRKDVMKALRKAVPIISLRCYSDHRETHQRIKLYCVSMMEIKAKDIKEWLSINGHPQVSVETHTNITVYGYYADSIIICFPHSAYC